MTPDAPPDFHQLLKSYRLAAGFTQESLAERAGLSARAISDLERGLKHTPRIDTVERLVVSLTLSGQERLMFLAAARRLGGSTETSRHPGSPPRVGAALPSLTGRAHELEMLDAHIAGDGPPVLLFAGEPGIGKSRLLREASLRAEMAGFRVLRGGCQRRGGQDPFAPVVGALQSHLRSRLPVHLRADLQGCAWLVRLLPELADGPIDPLPSRALLPAQERRLAFEAAGRFLANVSAGAGTMLILDDLQWAGVDALDLLMSLTGAAQESRLRLIGAYRDTEVVPRDPLSVALADLAHAESARQHTVPPLDPRAAGSLLDDLLKGMEDDARASSRATRDHVLQRAGGVPFYLVSFANGLRSLSTLGASGAEAMPWDVRQGLQQRVGRLSEAAQEILEVASIAGRVAERPLLAKASALPEREMVNALDTVCAGRLLETAGQGTYQFPHDVIREVVEANLGPARRALLHRTVAEAVEQVYADQLPEHYEALALHCLSGEVWEKALDYLVKAGDKAAASYAHQRALDAYASADGRLP